MTIDVVRPNDSLYPEAFRAIKNPPKEIFIRGNLELLNNPCSIAIVGARKCTDIGRKNAAEAAGFFAGKGYSIVSGLAIGIDTSAHKAALEAGGGTVAVVVGVKNISPKENAALARDILKGGGLLIAENPPGTPPQKYHFVLRDRLQSALSKAVLVIETDIDGGAMHTARFAMEQGKKVYCPDIAKFYSKDIPAVRGIKKLISGKIAATYSSLNIFPKALDF